MKSFLFRLYLQILKFGARFIPIKDNKIVVLNGSGRSGSNGYLFYKYLRTRHPEYQTTLVEPWPSAHLPLKVWRELGAAKYILTTHQPFKIHRGQINIQFWHGVPLKRMGIMANNTKRRDNRRNEKLWQQNADIVCSSSDLYESLMSACMAIETQKYHKVGFPRLDYLSKPAVDHQQLLNDLFQVTDSKAEIGIYLPTFRYELEDDTVMTKIAAGNFFVFADFDAAKLNAALKAQHQYLIVKLHPYEMRLFSSFKSQYSNIAFLNNDYLFTHNYDLYELLGSTDFLITDFSSIYFDYLQLNKPIIFVTNFLAQYEKVRGLLMGPYAKVVPGVCVNSQAELLQQLAAKDNSEIKAKRQRLLAVIDQVNENSSCEQVFALLAKS